MNSATDLVSSSNHKIMQMLCVYSAVVVMVSGKDAVSVFGAR